MTLKSNPRAWRTSAYDCVHFNLPRATLDAFTSDSDVAAVRHSVMSSGEKR